MNCTIDNLPMRFQPIKPNGFDVYVCPRGHIFEPPANTGAPTLFNLAYLAVATVGTAEIVAMMADDGVLLICCQSCGAYAVMHEATNGIAPCGHPWGLYRLTSSGMSST